MSKFHSTVSRRDFMKALGLGAAGLGAAGAASPVFHDFDEIVASPKGAGEKRPWWQREREYLNPVTQIDWNVMQRFGDYNNFTGHLTSEENNFRETRRVALRKKSILDHRIGFTLRDYALRVACWGPVTNGRVSTMMTGVDPRFAGENNHLLFGDLQHFQVNAGFPKWQGSPEENSRMLRTACRYCGGGTVGFGELIEGKTKKMVFRNQPMTGTQSFEFEDVDEPYQVPYQKYVTPNKYRYAIVCNVNQDITHMRLAPSALSEAAVARGYDQADILNYRILAFLKVLGYGGVGADITGMVPRPGWGEIAGLGEVGRIHELITPETGPLFRESHVIFTDLPLAPTNPIEFGASRFCTTSCLKCADLCPNLAIQYGDKKWDMTPSTATDGNPDHLKPELFNNPGHETWWLNHFACKDYWVQIETGCSICAGECVFTKERMASIHEFVKPIVSLTSLFNGFFYNMDVAFGYGCLPEERWNDFWEEDRPIVGLNY